MSKRVTTFIAFKRFVNRQARSRRIINRDRHGFASWNTCAVGDFHKEQTGTRPTGRYDLNEWTADTLPRALHIHLNDPALSPKSYGRLQDLMVELKV
jgi:hypothetical protein